MNESKILLETEFKDSLGKNEFDVRIVDHFSNIVLGECVEVDIRHPEEDFRGTYRKENFSGKFLGDLEKRGWDFVLQEIQGRL